MASTIGRIMEEAGDKMEGNIDEIKINYSQRMQKLEDIIKKVRIFYSSGRCLSFFSLVLIWKTFLLVDCVKRDFSQK